MPKTKKVNKKKNTTSKKDVIVKTITVVAVIVVLAIVYNFINNLETIRVTVQEHEFYQYLVGNKVEYTGSLKMTRKNDITELTTDEGIISLDSTPVYYKDERDKVILPENMAIAFPMNNGEIKKVNSLSTIYIDYGTVYIQKGDLNREIYDAFLYDGDALYFFIENTTVTINGMEYKLPPLSYVNATYKGYVEIYNYDTDSYEYIESADTDIIAKTDKYTINLSVDSMQYAEKEQLLITRIKNLPNLTNK